MHWHVIGEDVRDGMLETRDGWWLALHLEKQSDHVLLVELIFGQRVEQHQLPRHWQSQHQQGLAEQSYAGQEVLMVAHEKSGMRTVEQVVLQIVYLPSRGLAGDWLGLVQTFLQLSSVQSEILFALM